MKGEEGAPSSCGAPSCIYMILDVLLDILFEGIYFLCAWSKDNLLLPFVGVLVVGNLVSGTFRMFFRGFS